MGGIGADETGARVDQRAVRVEIGLSGVQDDEGKVELVVSQRLAGVCSTSGPSQGTSRVDAHSTPRLSSLRDVAASAEGREDKVRLTQTISLKTRKHVQV